MTKRMMTVVLACAVLSVGAAGSTGCDGRPRNTTALDEQAKTEQNQRGLLTAQPPPTLSWSLERDNLIKRFKLMNDRGTMFYMYVFIEGVADPVGYYMVNKVSSVDSQLTNPDQVIWASGGSQSHVVASPAEDGSYGTNGNGVFGFTPEDAYVEHNLKYITSTIPLTFAKPVVRLAVVQGDEARALLEKTRAVMSK